MSLAGQRCAKNFFGRLQMSQLAKRTICVAATVLLTSSLATAADLPSRPAPTAYVAVPTYNWTGIYLGISGGYAFGRSAPMGLYSSSFSAFEYDANGWLFGLTAGAQIQSGHVVLGLEADINWANLSGSASGPIRYNGAQIGTATLSSEVNSISTARARVGYAANNWLLYATGGLAITKETSNLTSSVGFVCGTGAANSPPCTSPSDLHVGVAAGAGFEYGFTPNLSSKFEYIWVGAGASNTFKASMLRAGLNYRFGGN
jgi:outer membrane immunogenic protein